MVPEAEQHAFFMNLTQVRLEDALGGQGNPLHNVLDRIARARSVIATELLLRLRAITSRGPIPVCGDKESPNTVGLSIENALGISPNPCKQPDYRGVIELKSSRGKTSRDQLFCKVADWSQSNCGSAREFRQRVDLFRPTGFHPTVSCSGSGNTYGLKLEVDSKAEHLHELHNGDKLLTWSMSVLLDELMAKHRETFWVDATMEEQRDSFRIHRVRHTRSPLSGMFATLLSEGHISVDHLFSGAGASDGGPSFKIKKNEKHQLFPLAVTYEF